MIEAPAFDRQNFRGFWDPKEHPKIGKREALPGQETEPQGTERITYIGCIHGAENNTNFFGRLNALKATPPDVLIMGGDIIGTAKFTELQNRYYALTNFSKGEILKQKPDATDADILAYKGTKQQAEGFTLRKGFLNLRSYELELAGKTSEEIQEILADTDDTTIASEIRRYAEYTHYGHYASNLPMETKLTLAAGLEENAQKIVDVTKEIQAQGTQVTIIEGNWDARSPIDFIPDTFPPVPLPREQRLFNPKAFFDNQGIDFYTELGAVETETTYQVLLPFDMLANFDDIPEERVTEVQGQIATAREKDKKVTIVAHGEPNWQIHNMTVPDAQPVGEHAQIIAGFEKALVTFHPNEIIHPHMHAPLVDQHGTELGVNTKYALAITPEGRVQVIQDKAMVTGQHTIVSFVPLTLFAEMQNGVPPRPETMDLAQVS